MRIVTRDFSGGSRLRLLPVGFGAGSLLFWPLPLGNRASGRAPGSRS